MKKKFPIIFMLLVFINQHAFAQKIKTPCLEIVPNNSTHIGRILKDSIIVITGSTYSFTVDTPEDSGLVSTNTRVNQLLSQIRSKDGCGQQHSVTDKNGTLKNEGPLINGDKLIVASADGKSRKTYHISVQPMAINGRLWLDKKDRTVQTSSDLTLYFTAGQRTPDATVKIYIPKEIMITNDNTTINVIGRGAVKLRDLPMQPIGRVGTNYSNNKVGDYEIKKLRDKSTLLLLRHLDLRPSNGADLVITISNVNFILSSKKVFKASYTTSKPEVLNSAVATTTLTVSRTIADLERVVDKSLQYKEAPDTYTKTNFRWSATQKTSVIELWQSTDKGKNWIYVPAKIDTKKGMAAISNLKSNQLYQFKLLMKDGWYRGYSNIVQFYSGKMDIKSLGVIADGNTDNTDKINEAIDYLNQIGGGTLLFSNGIYNLRTAHLKSNVYLYVDKGATIRSIKGADAPETTWFSDKKYRSGLSPTDSGPYADPENYMTKQDVGHHYFRNTMFFGERLDNVKIIGNGYITGDGNLVTGDNVMRNAPGNRADKMFTLKLCTNLEIGGIYREEDLWYDPAKDEPYYIKKDGSKDFDTDNMLKIDRAGHFALLATGTDNINVHNTYFAKYSESNVRDIYDFMECSNVTVTNIYSKVSSDDIVKPGSDCSLGFTRPARNYKVRNVIGDTNCNLFQIGSETADDVMDIHVDNIYVLGANKAGFSISTNDGGHIKDIHLNCGHTGSLHSRSKMLRTYAPFFISISNRGRILGASVERYKFYDDTVKHDELLVTNVNIGMVENILINGIDITEVYAGSSFGDKPKRWDAYDSQRKTTSIIAGYSLPDTRNVGGGLKFTLPNGLHTGYIKNISFNDVNILYKGGNAASDTTRNPGELGVGQYNASNLGVLPSYGLWARHVIDLTVTNITFNFEKTDNRYAIFLDDVHGATFSEVKAMKAKNNNTIIKLHNSSSIKIDNTVSFSHEWGKQPADVPVGKGN